MIKDKINNLIILLMAVHAYAKDIHYSCSGDNFYGNHLFADRIAENLNDYIDQLKEICLLGHGIEPLASSDYFKKAAEKIPAEKDFGKMSSLILMALGEIEGLQDISKGDENLLGAIAQDLQNNYGLLNIMNGV